MKNRYGSRDGVRDVQDVVVDVVCARVNEQYGGERRVLVDVGSDASEVNKGKHKGTNKNVRVNNVEISQIDKPTANMLIQNSNK